MIAGLAWAGSGVVGAPARARPVSQAPIVSWSEPRIVWETTGHTSNPTLVTDAWGRAHLFFMSQGEGEAENTLYHVDADNPDAVPVDVLVGMNEYRVASDPYGRLHVIAQGGTNTMTYTSVAGIEGSNAGAWSASQTLGEATLGIDISADADGGLHLCYPNNHAAFYQRSIDGGRNWLDPSTIADMSDPAGVATYVRCAADTAGAVHVAWAEARPPNFYPPEGVYYSRSTDGGQNWEAPEQIAGQHYSLPALLADPVGIIHLLWQGDVAVGGRYYRQRPSGDKGTWSTTETVVPAGRGGMSGDAFLALDSRNTLHVGINVDGIYWATRKSSWTAPLELSGSVRNLPNPSGSIEQATLAIANGNEIYVAFEFDFKRIYLLTGQSDAPPAARTPLAGATATADPEIGITTPILPLTTVSPSPPPKSLAAEALATANENRRGTLPTLLATGLGLLVVLSAIWFRTKLRP